MSDEQRRFYEIAGITVRVESELPFTDATFDKKFASFAVDGPGADTVVIRHHFGLPGDEALAAALEGGEEVYRHPPWAIARTPGSWVYLGIAPQPDDPTLHRVAFFNDDHTLGELYNPAESREWWREGGLGSLSMFPSDQIWLARLLADRDACFLHSGGMLIDGQGFLFVGHSDAGKSTTMELVRGALGERADDPLRRPQHRAPLAAGLRRRPARLLGPRHLEPRRRARRLVGRGAAARHPLPRAVADQRDRAADRPQGGLEAAAGDAHPAAGDRRLVGEGAGRAASRSWTRCPATRCASTGAARSCPSWRSWPGRSRRGERLRPPRPRRLGARPLAPRRSSTSSSPSAATTTASTAASTCRPATRRRAPAR